MKTLRGGPLDGKKIVGGSDAITVPVIGRTDGDTVTFLTGCYTAAGGWTYEGAR